MDKPILASILSCQTTRLTDKEKYLFEKFNPLGVSLFARNIETKEQLKALVDDIKNTINRDDILIGIDQEGGRVSRISSLSNNKYVSQKTLGKNPIEYTQAHATLIANELHEYGININYSPVVDKSSSSSVLATRCFSSNSKDIEAYATQMANTYIDMGICPCIKHIPGHFAVSKDPHLEVLEIDIPPKEVIKEIEYLSFIAKYPMAMTSHIKLSQIDNKNPTTTSPKIISNIIRETLNFDGFLISDAIDMHALKGTIEEKHNQALDAKIDATCYCAGKIEDLEQICYSKRFMTEKSLIRFENIKKVIHNKPNKVNIEALKNFYNNGLKDWLSETYLYDATEVLHQMQKKGEYL